MTAPRTPADRDPEGRPVTPPLRYDYEVPGAYDAIRPTLDTLARICDRIATATAKRDEPERKAS